jgi:hypothetical protein
MPKQTIRSPYTTDSADQLSKRIFRKQILKFGDIDYHGRVISFDKDYAEGVIASFRDQAFDTVPFVLADADNKHTRDPLRARGEIIDLEATETGLDAVITLNQDAAKIVEDNPKFGVSVSIKEQFQRADGKSYDKALAHVLGTFEPMLPGMSPWQTINASAEDEEILDLTTIDLATKEKEKGMPGQKKKYTEDEQDAMFARLEQLLTSMESDDEELESEEEDGEPEVAEGDEGGDITAQDIEELRAFLAQVDAGEFQPVAVEVNASQEDDARTIELSNQLRAQESQIRTLRAENDRRAFDAEKLKIAQVDGIPPFIIDMARPLLQGSGHEIELSDTGKKVDAGKIMRDVFEAVGKQIKLLDLSGELGNNLDFSERDEEDAEARVSRIKSIRKQMNI